MGCRQAVQSQEALDRAKAKEASASAKDQEAESKLAGLLHREQLVADYREQQAAAAKAAEAADQVLHIHILWSCTWHTLHDFAGTAPPSAAVL